MMKVNEFNETLNQTIHKFLKHNDTVSKALDYSLIQCAGKRIRPMVVINTAKSLDSTTQACANDLACAIECIHTYSLIHDDLPCMDNDDYRRGNLTCHKVYDQAFALLAADALNTLAFEIIAHSQYLDAIQKVKAIQVLSNLAGINGMIYGQCIDLESENKQIDFDTLQTLHYKKTGCLLVASFQLGAISAKRYDLLDTFEKIGYELGLAFQIQDDIFDVTKTSEELGKSNSDIENNKSTSVSLLGLDKAQKLCDQCFETVINLLQSIEFENKQPIQETVLAIMKRNY